jgi:hypothetical protein
LRVKEKAYTMALVSTSSIATCHEIRWNEIVRIVASCNRALSRFANLRPDSVKLCGSTAHGREE